MKPIYIMGIGAIVFRSIHEDDDWVVIIKSNRGENKNMRIYAKDPIEAANKAVDRYLSMANEYEKILPSSAIGSAVDC